MAPPMPVPLMVKSEPGKTVQITGNEELIIPDDTDSCMERPEASIKEEPTTSVGDCEEDLENPYQCFTCGLDCESQHDLITHYETKCWAHDVGSNEESMEAEGGGDLNTEETEDDPLIGDEAPSDGRVHNIGHAFDNSEGPHQLLFYCAFCGVASNKKQELMVHMESHVEVTYLSCAHCVHVYSDKYHLKNYKCRDELEKPHVCVHCSFRTQWWQELKDHCFSHHHRDMSPPHDVNRVASLGHPVTTASHNYLSGDLQSVNSTEAVGNPNSNLHNQQISIQNANKDYYVVVKNFGPKSHSTRSSTNSTNLETSTSSRPSSNEQYLKHLLVSNSMNAVTAPLLQSPKYLNTVSSTKPVKRKTPPLLPVSAIVQTSEQATPDQCFAPVKKEIPAVSSAVSMPIVVQSWPANVRNIAPRPPEVPGPQNLPTVIPKGLSPIPLQSTIVPPKPSMKSSTNKKPKANAKKKQGVIRKIPCPYCEYLSRDKWNLRTHILTHTKEKPFACQLCSYRASQAAHLRKHMLIHGRKRWEKEVLGK